jgi:hypothetical protein
MTEDVLKKYGSMTAQWRSAYAALTPKQKFQIASIIESNIFTEEAIASVDSTIREVLQYYRIKRYSQNYEF